MPRRLKNTKPLIFVFCEGESEQAYTDFLKEEFADTAVIRRLAATGLFQDADNRFRNDPKYRDYAEVTDEIWFFFDVETKDQDKWGRRLRIIRRLRGLRKRPGIKIRLLMTTGCIEYWLLLHYKMFAPPVLTVADKERLLAELISREPAYVKGNYTATARIARQYPTAVTNARKILRQLLPDGLPGLEDTDTRNQWLHNSCRTFSTVYEAIDYLKALKEP